MNACFSINVAKMEAEDGNLLVGGTIIFHPLGHIIKEAKTKEDELIVTTVDLSDCHSLKNTVLAEPRSCCYKSEVDGNHLYYYSIRIGMSPRILQIVQVLSPLLF
jgi:hypothetical protein